MNVETKYLRMIQGMKRRGRKDWTVYILRCGDGSLYTGIAKDVRARVKQHSEGRGATYTRTRLPVKLLYQQEGLTRSKALIREAQIKAMPRSKKEEIIDSLHNPVFKLRSWPPQKRTPIWCPRAPMIGRFDDSPCFLAENSILKKRNLAAKSPFLDVRPAKNSKQLLCGFFYQALS